MSQDEIEFQNIYSSSSKMRKKQSNDQRDASNKNYQIQLDQEEEIEENYVQDFYDQDDDISTNKEQIDQEKGQQEGKTVGEQENGSGKMNYIYLIIIALSFISFSIYVVLRDYPNVCMGKYKDEDQCVTDCSQSMYENYDNENKKCKKCPKLAEGSQCVEQCTDPEIMLIQNSICYDECPDQNYLIYQNLCVLSCPLGTYQSGRVCLEKCEEKKFRSCLLDCSKEGKVQRESSCEDSCEKGEFIYKGICLSFCPLASFVLDGFCVQDCPSGYLQQEGFCVKECDENHGFILKLEGEDKVCQSVCLKNQLQQGVYCVSCLLFLNGVCVKDCPQSYFRFNQECIKECPQKTFKLFSGGTGLKKCVEECPQFYQGDSCVQRCDQGWGLSERVCKKCEFLLENQKCVQHCSDGFFEQDGLCILHCESGKFKQKNICVDRCQENFYVWEELCVSECPIQASFISGKKNQTLFCVEKCQNGQLVQDGKKCVDECEEGFFIYEKQKLCQQECDQFQWKNKCLENCKEEGLFSLEQGQEQHTCVEKCDQEKYFIHENSCVLECPKDFFIDKVTRECLKDCYIDQVLENEKFCVKKCEHFLSDGECVQFCPNQKKFAELGVCVEKCSSKHPFILAQRCFSECPAGYFQKANKNCEKCVEGCFKCNEPEKVCFECEQTKNYFLFEGQCTLECIQNTQGDCLDISQTCSNTIQQNTVQNNKSNFTYYYLKPSKNVTNAIFALHDYAENPQFFLQGKIGCLAEETSTLIVSFNAEATFYQDFENYHQIIELIKKEFKTVTKWGIVGIGMGGFGAMLQNQYYPESYSFIVAQDFDFQYNFSQLINIKNRIYQINQKNKKILTIEQPTQNQTINKTKNLLIIQTLNDDNEIQQKRNTLYKQYCENIKKDQKSKCIFIEDNQNKIDNHFQGFVNLFQHSIQFADIQNKQIKLENDQE